MQTEFVVLISIMKLRIVSEYAVVILLPIVALFRFHFRHLSGLTEFGCCIVFIVRTTSVIGHFPKISTKPPEHAVCQV